MYEKYNKFLNRTHKKQKGITGLETAIILIAFVVVAAVFAYTVLSAGLFATQKSSEAVYSGLEEARSSLELKGSVITDGVAMLEDMETAWTSGGATCTLDTDAGDFMEGLGSALFTTVGAADTTIEGYFDSTTVAAADWNLSNCDSVSFWIRSSVDLSAAASNGDLEIVLSEADDGTGTTENLDIPVAELDTTWNHVTINLGGTTTNYDAVKSVALYCVDATNISGNIHLDGLTTEAFRDIDEQPTLYATNLVFTVSNVLNGEPIDFSTTTDSDEDGLLSDEATPEHKVIVYFHDKYQYVPDIAWTKTAVGDDDGDDLLEANEKFQITVDLKYPNDQTATAAEKVGGYHTFRLEIKPAVGGVMTFEKSMPSIIHQVDSLN